MKGGCGRMKLRCANQGRPPALALARGALHLAEPAQELVDQERRLGLLGRIAGRTARRRIGGAVDRQPHVLRRIGQLVPARCQPGQPGAMILRHAHSYAHAGQNALVGTQPGVVARDRARVDGLVRIAEQRRVVAGPAGGKRDGVVPRIERRAVAHHPVGHLVETGIEAGTCRRAGRGLAVVAGEIHRFPCQGVDIRRAHDRVAGDPETVAAPLVGGDEKHVERHRQTFKTKFSAG